MKAEMEQDVCGGEPESHSHIASVALCFFLPLRQCLGFDAADE